MLLRNLEPKDLIALIGIFFTLFISLLNAVISIHKSQAETIIQSKIQNLDTIRKLSGEILCWRYSDNIGELRSKITQLIFYFDPLIENDDEIVHILLQLLENGYKLTFYENFKSPEARQVFETYHKNKKDFNYLMKVVLMRERIRIDVENQVFKIPLRYYWIPIKGFCEKWATKSLKRKMNGVYSNFPSTWLLLKGELKEDKINDIVDQQEYNSRIPSMMSPVVENSDETSTSTGELNEKKNSDLINISFLNPFTGASLQAEVDGNITVDEVIKALIDENFLLPIKGSGEYYLMSDYSALSAHAHKRVKRSRTAL